MNALPRRRLAAPTPPLATPPLRRRLPESEFLNLKLLVVYRPIDELKANPRNPRTHPKKHVGQLKASIKQFGFTSPILIDENGEIIAGMGRFAAAQALGMTEVPTITLRGLTPAQRRALVIADNKLALNSGWNEIILAEELKFLSDPEIALEGFTGFETVEIDTLIELLEPGSDSRVEVVPEPPQTSVSHLGDVWILGDHRLVCGDAKDDAAYAALMGDNKARMIVADSPFNVPVQGHVSGLGRVQHREFAEASGEMTVDQFIQFLIVIMKLTRAVCLDGAIGYWFMDWAHTSEMMAAIEGADLQHKQLVVWTKPNAGMGNFYRSQHELVFVTKNGRGPHVNNFGLGGHGRYRTNVWSYAGMNSFGRHRDELLALHPTVKPVALVEDAIKDVSHRGDIVLDPFGGSGTTLIAAEKCKRRARLIEIDPIYCDVIVRRWEKYTRGKARHESSNHTFAEIALERTSD